MRAVILTPEQHTLLSTIALDLHEAAGVYDNFDTHQGDNVAQRLRQHRAKLLNLFLQTGACRVVADPN